MTRSNRAARWILVGTLAALASSCAFYNTYYLARKYYDKGTEGKPYALDKPDPADAQNFTKSVEYSKKLIAQYPKSKWVDDSYLLWARALLTDDPRQSIKLLEGFSEQFPKSPLRDEATFYLGVAYRQAHKYKDALRELDAFVEHSPRHSLAPYAHLERARVLMALERPGDAAAAAGQVLERFPRSDLAVQARIARAEGRLKQKEFNLARQDFRHLGQRSKDDDQRLDYLLREADCLEGARDYDAELVLLKDAISHAREPVGADTLASLSGGFQQTPGYDHHGKLMIRIATVHMLSGRLDEALTAYRRVARDYPRYPLAAEAHYRSGYAFEVLGDDFEKARSEYSQVKDYMGSPFAAQAQQRLSNLERLAQFRGASGDSVDKKAEAGFLLAELYLFQLEKPERALEEYRKVEQQFPGSPQAAKAINAQAWVLSRKLERKNEADSLFWKVVHKYPATEAQLAARDYLELEGVSVPENLIKLPERKLAVVDTLPQLAQPPGTTVAFGPGSPGAPGDPAAVLDSVPHFGPRGRRPGYLPLQGYLPASGGSPGISGDVPSGASPIPRYGAPRAGMRDTTRVPGSSGTSPPRPPQQAPADTTKGPR